MCKGNACGCGGSRSSWLPAAVLLAVAVDAAAAVVASVVVALLVAVAVLAVAGTGYLVHVLRRDGLRLYAPVRPPAVPAVSPPALPASGQAAIGPARPVVIPGFVLDGQEASR